MIAGLPKAGKTTLAATASKPLIVMTDPGGHVSLAENEALSNTPIEYIPTLDCVAKIKAIVQKLKKPQDEYDTLVLDTLSSVQYLHTAYLNKSDKKSRNLFAEANDDIIELMWDMTLLPMNVILLCHVRFARNEQGKIEEANPDISEGLRQKVSAITDAIWFLQNGVGGRRTLQSEPGPNHVVSAGGRFELDSAMMTITKETGFKKIEAQLNKYKENNS